MAVIGSNKGEIVRKNVLNEAHSFRSREFGQWNHGEIRKKPESLIVFFQKLKKTHTTKARK
ncbi:hypothetical protein PGB28_15390 [Primorskyibacter aestuariivivens]|uniref:hypothetical protein n=1 Tax=Primorskyibacter aestuariivivens TaxID=1888912 RepID=UPI002301ECD8|nr:hypothetical protein [Primorskyibacter aestuariivivens]MDA7429848.1 hypothetical protein [Primorskyibacter aestuariivivens]